MLPEKENNNLENLRYLDIGTLLIYLPMTFNVK